MLRLIVLETFEQYNYLCISVEQPERLVGVLYKGFHLTNTVAINCDSCLTVTMHRLDLP